MSTITNNLSSDWYAEDRIVFSGTVSGLPTGADPTDYTLSFEITRSGTILDTMTDTLDASGNYSIDHSLDAGVTGGSYVTVHIKLTWSTHTDYVGSFNKFVRTKPSTS